MIAALYVETGGAYFGLPDVDPWDELRDARLYTGTGAVVAHPPCARWGRYWHGGPSAKVRRVKGDDGGLFAHALATVRRCGGVLEHPQASAAWAHFGLLTPPFHGGWTQAGDGLGWTCCVAQAHYGHAAEKMTWLYAVGCELPSLRWGRARGRPRLDGWGAQTAEVRARYKAEGRPKAKRIPQNTLAATPVPFRDVLLAMARSVP